MDSDGDFVITWHSKVQDGSGSGIYAKRFNASGVAQGGEFRVNTYTTSGQRLPSIAIDNDGDFVIAWQGEGLGDNSGIYAQRFQMTICDPPSNPMTSNVMETSADLSWDTEPNAENYEVQYRVLGTTTWTSETTATNSLSLTGLIKGFIYEWQVKAICNTAASFGSVFSNLVNFTTDIAVGSEFQVNTYTTSGQTNVQGAMDSDGDFVVVWQSDGQDGSQNGIFAQRCGHGR